MYLFLKRRRSRTRPYFFGVLSGRFYKAAMYFYLTRRRRPPAHQTRSGGFSWCRRTNTVVLWRFETGARPGSVFVLRRSRRRSRRGSPTSELLLFPSALPPQTATRPSWLETIFSFYRWTVFNRSGIGMYTFSRAASERTNYGEPTEVFARCFRSGHSSRR